MLALYLFRKNDPFLNIVLIIILVILRLCFTFFGEFTVVSEQPGNSYLLQEVLSLNINNYGHIWLSTLFIAINMLFLNELFRSNQAFDETNYLGGLVYIVLTNSDQRFFTLSGELLATTCLLLALRLILSHVKQRASEENIFFTGVLMGLSVLFYSPMSILLVVTLLIYVFYTRTLPRRYALSTFAFLFPFIITFSISLFTDNLLSLGYFFSVFFVDSFLKIEWGKMIFLVLPLLIMVYKLLGSFTGIKMTNHQIHVQRVMFLLILVAAYVCFVDALGSGFLWIIIIPATYFITKTLLEIQKKWIQLTVFYLLIGHIAYPYLSAAYF